MSRSLRLVSRHQHRLISPPRLLSTATISVAPEPTSTLTTRQVILRSIGFGVFSVSCGVAAISYVLVTDPVQVKWARDRYPWLMNKVFTPMLSLPPPYTPPTLDLEEEGILVDVSEAVGKEVVVAARFPPGKGAVLITVDAHANMNMVTEAARKAHPLVGNVSVERIVVVEPVDAHQWSTLTPSELEIMLDNQDDARIPEIPSVVTETTIMLALELCHKVDVDLTVRQKLAQDEYTRQRLGKSLAALESRRAELEKLLPPRRGFWSYLGWR